MYRVELNGKVIGETQLESADPPMGVVRGKVTFKIEDDPYLLIKSHCQIHGILINQDEKEIGLIDTQNIASLKVFRIDGVEIAGLPGTSICGFRDEGYEITILGVPYPFYEEEFPHHCAAYEAQFKI
ncbi:MAG: hypothetical protein ACK5S4_00415 [bacterium]